MDSIIRNIPYQAVFLALTALGTQVFGQAAADFSRAPNSYIFDIAKAEQNGYSGLMIPVKKAYTLWQSHPYFQKNGTNSPVPAGNAEAFLVWEDVAGLVSEVSLVSGATPEEGKIRAKIMAKRGKGNAVVALRIDGQVYWSWHIWVTDDPSQD